MIIHQKYTQRVAAIKSMLCVGLDSELEKLPSAFQTKQHPQFEFNKWIIEQTHDLAAAYKPNAAFYEARGAAGWSELQMTMDYLRSEHPDIVTILDAKRADIGNTNNGYVTGIFDQLGFDAVTLHPYLGQEALQPFLDRKDKACIILCKTSNPGAGELQDLRVSAAGADQNNSKSIWQIVAETVSQKWNKNNNCMLVVGATYPEDLAAIRKITGEMLFLVPGVGAQGGAVSDLTGGVTPSGGMIINSARGIIFDTDPRQAALKLATEIQSSLLSQL